MLPARLPCTPAKGEKAMNGFVLNGLVKRRAEIAGDVENAHEACERWF
jgi:hypothetical protein